MTSFSLGAVILPASDGMLADLGYDVKALGPLAMGFVIEEGSKRAHVHFPEIKMSLWLGHEEIKDVALEIKINPAFKIVEKYFQNNFEEMLLPLLASFLISELKASHVLGVDHGSMENVWEEAPAKLREYYEGNLTTDVFRLSLGLEELNPKQWDDIQKRLGKRLLLQRFLPSGMYKFELSLYLRR